jgi:shikimate dehydrogenase
MISLSLLGKDIAHSKSHELYEELLDQKIEYTKYDVSHSSNIPNLDTVFKDNQGLSITSPYKKHFLAQVKMSDEIKSLNAINCIRSEEGVYEGTNTDYLALKETFLDFKKLYGEIEFEILGDGSMSYVTQVLCDQLSIEYQVLSRKITPSFNTIKLNVTNSSFQKIIINTCSRDYIFSGVFDSGIIFLDYNYNFTPHKKHFLSLQGRYIDGMGLLKSQAKYALQFWKIRN